jgi:hypothetical protein
MNHRAESDQTVDPWRFAGGFIEKMLSRAIPDEPSHPEIPWAKVTRPLRECRVALLTLNMIWVYQRLVGMPRVAAIEHPFGRPFGDCGDAETQTEVLRAAHHRPPTGL